MNKQDKLLWKIDALLAFIDLKVLLLGWILIDLYRNTMWLGDLNGKKTMKVAVTMQYIWETCGSPYIIWIPILAVADIFIKKTVKGMLE